MSKGIVIAGFGAIGKTTVGNKYDNFIDLESSYYKWDNTGLSNLSSEELKGIVRPINKEWPINYYKAIVDAREKYDIVLTSMHEHVLKFLEKNKIDYYLAFPTLDSVDIIKQRCYLRGNNENFVRILIDTLYDFNQKINDYHPIEIFIINKNEYLEDVLIKNGIINKGDVFQE